MNAEYALKLLVDYQERIQEAHFQETKDCMLCQTVIALSHFAPAQVKEKALEVLKTYNSEESKLTVMQEAGIAMAANIVDQGERIEALQALVREWREAATTDDYCFSCFDDLQEKTAQELEEAPLNIKDHRECNREKGQ